MGAATPEARVHFVADLSTALDLSAAANTTKHRAAQSKIFGNWQDFCEELGKSPNLLDTPADDRLSYLLVWGLRYRLKGQRNKPVRADTVEKALTAIGQGISNLGGEDPRLGPNGKLKPVLSDFLKALGDEDSPTDRAYPVNTTILRAMFDQLDTGDPEWGVLNRHAQDLIVVAFFWLLRPAEYTNEDPKARSQAFRLCDVQFTMDGRVFAAATAPLHDEEDLERISFASLTFSDQKNAVRGEMVGHQPNDDPTLCPCKALGRIVLHLRERHAAPDTPLHHHYNNHATHKRWYPMKPTHITNALRHAAKAVKDITGIDPFKISARSLRPGGATALLCANVGSDAIMLLGRWKSDAMLRYLRIQAAAQAHNYAQKMLTHGAYTFHPQALAAGNLPDQAPLEVQALLNEPTAQEILDHPELYD